MDVVSVTSLYPIRQIFLKVLVLCSKYNTCTYAELVWPIISSILYTHTFESYKQFGFRKILEYKEEATL